LHKGVCRRRAYSYCQGGNRRHRGSGSRWNCTARSAEQLTLFMTARAASSELLTRLLDAYERSSSYGCPGPWRRDFILKLDSGTFPGAFAPNGRDQYTELMRAALDLEQEASVRIVRYARGPLCGEPKELRLGSVELYQAYRSSVALGY